MATILGVGTAIGKLEVHVIFHLGNGCLKRWCLVTLKCLKSLETLSVQNEGS